MKGGSVYMEDNEEYNEEDLKEMQEFFDAHVWPNMKKEVKDMTKKESCFFAFFAGTEAVEEEEEELAKTD